MMIIFLTIATIVLAVLAWMLIAARWKDNRDIRACIIELRTHVKRLENGEEHILPMWIRHEWLEVDDE